MRERLRSLMLAVGVAALAAACGDNAPASDAGLPDSTERADARVDASGLEPDGPLGELSIVVDPTTITLDEGGTPDTFAVSLSRAPAANVTLTVASSDDTLVPVAPTTLTFTPANFGTPQNVGLAAEDDADLDDESITITVSGEGLADATVAVTVTDDDAQQIVVEPTSLDVTEGDTAAIGVALAFAPAANVTVTVTSADVDSATVAPTELTFTPANYATPQQVSVTGVQDADTVNESVAVTVASTGLTSVAVAVTVIDDDALNLDVSPGSLALTEGGAAGIISVSLTQMPAADVTVNVATSDAGAGAISTTELTFTPGNYATPQTINVTPAQDGDVADENLTITLSSAGLTTRTVDVSVDDDDVQTIVPSATTVAVAEGGTVTFTAALQFNPGVDTTVVVAPSDLSIIGAAPITLTFTAANFAVPQTVTVSGIQDADLTGETGTITLQALGIAPTVVTVNVTDDDNQEILATPNPASVIEGQTSNVGVTLAFQPAANVTVNVAGSDPLVLAVSPATLTFTPANYNVAQNVVLMGVNDADLENEPGSVALSSTGLTTVNIPVTIQDDDAQNILVNPTAVGLTEGGPTGAIMVSLSFMPAADTTVTVTSADPGAVTALPATLTFTTTNYGTPQAVTVAPIGDADTRNESVVVTFAATGIPDGTSTVTVTDDDTQALIVEPTSVAVTEQGTTATFTVHMQAEPNDTRTVTITPADAGAVATDLGTLTFTTLDWMTPQTVTVSGVADPDLADENTSILLSAAGSSAPDVSVGVTVTDDDAQALVVAPDTVNVTEDTPSGDDQFSVQLSNQPAGPVTVTVTSNNPAAAAVSTGSLTFTPANYNVAQLVSVTGVTDANQTNTTTTITVASAGLTSQTVNVNVIDDDEQAIIVEPGIIGVSEGATETFTVRLAYEPLGGSETLTLVSQNPGEVPVSTGTIAFTTADYMNPVTVTVSPPEDADIVNEDVQIDITSNRVSTPANFALVNVTDNDSQQILRNPAQVTIYEDNEGNTADVNVHLQQDPSGSLAVTTTSLDATAVVVGAGGTLTFDSGTYTADQTFTVVAVSDLDLVDESVSVHSNASGVPTQVTNVIVIDDDNQAIVVSPGTVDVTEEGTATLNVHLAYQPSGNRSVTITSADPAVATVTPTTLVFTPANYDVEQGVQVSGTADANLDPAATTLEVAMLGGLSAPEGADPVTVNVNVTDNDEQEIIVTTVDTRLQEGGPGRSYTVHLAFPPALANGGVDQVDVFSTGEYLTDDVDGPLFFTTANFADPQTVTVYAPEDADEESREDTMRHTIAAYAYTPTTDQVFGITDDEITVIAEATLTQLNDGTEFTKRSNVRANPAGSLAITGLTAGGDIAGGSVSRDLTGFALVNGGAAYADPGADLSPIFAVEHDGTDFGFFSTETGTLVRYTRFVANLASVAVTSTFAGRDFWPANNGNQFGVIARHATNNNLFFRTLNPATGTFGSAIQVTTASPTVHEHPNLHHIGAGWVALYSAAAEVRCVVMAANGAPTLNVALGGYPSGGAYVSSIYDPNINRIVTVHVDPTNGLYMNEIDPGNCNVTDSRRLRGSDNYINVPSLAFNGEEFLIGYDVVTPGGNQVGVMRGTIEDYQNVISNAQRPSVDWVGDRWVLRAALDGGGIHVMVGSFQTHCVNGVQDSDETGIDCGGSICGWCPSEYSFTDTADDDVTTTSLLDFFNGLPQTPGPNDWMYVEIQGPTGWNGSFAHAMCLRGADFYTSNYVLHANDGGQSICNPDGFRYFRNVGDANWCQAEEGCNTSYFGRDSWGNNTAAYYFVPESGYIGFTGTGFTPGDTGQCEIHQPGWTCGDGTWSGRIRVGGSREGTCPGSFDVNPNCGGGGGD